MIECRCRCLSVECEGTEHRLADRYASNPHERLQFYRDRYENCTMVTSNLELVHLYPDPGTDYDLSFLENIREVHGYVLVAVYLASRLPLTSLRVIRGLAQYELPPRSSNHSKTLEEEDGVGFSLYVAGNIHRRQDGTIIQGLQVLELPALRGTPYCRPKCVFVYSAPSIQVNSAWPSPFMGRHNGYQPKSNDALRLGSRGRYDLCVGGR